MELVWRLFCSDEVAREGLLDEVPLEPDLRRGESDLKAVGWTSGLSAEGTGSAQTLGGNMVRKLKLKQRGM